MKSNLPTQASADVVSLLPASANWDAGKEQYATVRSAIRQSLDSSVPVSMAPDAVIGVNGEDQPGAIARMAHRSLLLSEALHLHALRQIADAGALLDAISRATARKNDQQ